MCLGYSVTHQKITDWVKFLLRLYVYLALLEKSWIHFFLHFFTIPDILTKVLITSMSHCLMESGWVSTWAEYSLTILIPRLYQKNLAASFVNLQLLAYSMHLRTWKLVPCHVQWGLYILNIICSRSLFIYQIVFMEVIEIHINWGNLF